MDTKPRKKPGPKPLIPGEIMKQQLVSVDSLTLRKLRVLGGDNISAGVRKAAEVAYEKYQNEKD